MLCKWHVFVHSQTATRNAKTEIEILQRVNHVSLKPQKKSFQTSDELLTALSLSPPFFSLLRLCVSLNPLLQPCLIRTEDFYQTEDSYYIVLELWAERRHFTLTDPALCKGAVCLSLSVFLPAHLSLRMEGGELFHRVKSQQQLSECVAKLYFYQMLRAVQVRVTRCCYGN